MAPLPVHAVLMPEGCEDLARCQAARAAEVKYMEKPKEPNYPAIHMEHFRANGLRYPPELHVIYTEEEINKLAVMPLSPTYQRSVSCGSGFGMRAKRLARFSD